jgi:hypothetical protein
MRRHRLILAALLTLVIALAARSHPPPGLTANPAARVDAHTPVPAPVMSTLRRACFDCHSDETRWPWYSTLPVASWLLEYDVREGRGRLNFSRWTEYSRFERADLLDRACELATRRVMPLWQYRLLHGEARLGAADIAALCAWSRHEATRLIDEGP